MFVAILGFSALRLLFWPNGWKFAEEMPGRLLMSVYGLIIGSLSALMGIGGGQIANLFMTFHGRSIHQAVATSSGLGALIAIPGMLGFIYAGWPRAAEFPNAVPLQFPYALGYVSLIGMLLVIPTSTLVAPLGARLAHALTKRQLEVAFGVFLLSAEREIFDEFDLVARHEAKRNPGSLDAAVAPDCFASSDDGSAHFGFSAPKNPTMLCSLPSRNSAMSMPSGSEMPFGCSSFQPKRAQ